MTLHPRKLSLRYQFKTCSNITNENTRTDMNRSQFFGSLYSHHS